MMLNLSGELLRRGYIIDLVVNTSVGSLRDLVSDDANIIDLKVSRASFALAGLIKCIGKNRPEVFLASQTYNNIAALISNKFVRFPTSLFVSEHTDISMIKNLPSIKERMRPSLSRVFYPNAKGIIAPSKGVARSLIETAHIPEEKIKIIYNPIVTSELIKDSKKELHHPWFGPSDPPVILSVGRLVPEKDFGTLIRAFARLRERVTSRLIILGEGPERNALETLVDELGLSREVQLPGFQLNPYPYMSKSALFVLSSIREGLSSVLIEAMACGTPVVSTNCPSGPSEILEGGRFGILAPVGDAVTLAESMEETLINPLSPQMLREHAMEFSVESKTDQLLNYFFGQVL